MLYLMNTTVIPHGADGHWEMTTIDTKTAAQIVRENNFISAVGHVSSAKAMTVALGEPVSYNRFTVRPKPGDQFLCLRLLNRPAEGQILDLQALEIIGFTWSLMTYHGPESIPSRGAEVRRG